MNRTADPVADAERYWNERYISEEKWKRGNADCCVCGRTIEEVTCMVLDRRFEMQTAVCEVCEGRFRNDILNSNLHDATKTWLYEMFDDLSMATPHEEWKEG